MAQPKVKVLVVEDEPLVRALLTSLLEADGFQIKSASNAAEARSATKDFDPRVAILDIELGDGPSGIDLAHILRLQFPRSDLFSLLTSQNQELLELKTAISQKMLPTSEKTAWQIPEYSSKPLKQPRETASVNNSEMTRASATN